MPVRDCAARQAPRRCAYLPAGARAASPGPDRRGRAALFRRAGGAAGSFRRAADARRHQARRAATSRAALRLIGAALQQRPNSPQVLLNHGNVLNAMKRHDEALANFDEAIKRKRRFAEAHNNRGSVLIALGALRRGARQLQARDRDQARLCGRVLQPGQRAAAARPLRRGAQELRPRDRAAPELRQGALQPRRGARSARPARPRRSPDYDRALAIQPNFPKRCSTAAARCARSSASTRRCRRSTRCSPRIRTMPRRTTCAACCSPTSTGRPRRWRATSGPSRSSRTTARRAGRRACAALPILYADEAEIDRQRADYERRLRALLRRLRGRPHAAAT